MNRSALARRSGAAAVAAALALGGLAAGPASAAGISDGLVGYWAFNDTSNPVMDSSTNGYGNGTLVGDAALHPENPGGTGNVSSLKLDGDGDYATIADNGDVTLGEAVTLSAWVWVDATVADGVRNVVRKGNFSNREYGLDIDKETTGFRVRAFTNTSTSGGGGADIDYSAVVLPFAQWQHIAMTYNGSDVQVYVNGAASGTPTSASGDIYDNGLTVRIGGQPASEPGGGLAFKGYVDEVRIYNRALAASEVAGLSAPLTLTGFYQPVDMAGVFNTVKGGSTVPLKFNVYNGSTELTDVAVIDSFKTTSITCPSGTLNTDAVEMTSTGGTSLRYDTTAAQFIQNWKTPKKPGNCYSVTMTAIDGSHISADFLLK